MDLRTYLMSNAGPADVKALMVNPPQEFVPSCVGFEFTWSRRDKDCGYELSVEQPSGYRLIVEVRPHGDNFKLLIPLPITNLAQAEELITRPWIRAEHGALTADASEAACAERLCTMLAVADRIRNTIANSV